VEEPPGSHVPAVPLERDSGWNPRGRLGRPS
jgi:hypothetical protein